VVVVGAGKYGFEAALGMAKDGHKVTVLTTAKELYEAAFVGPHNMQNQENIYKYHPNFSYELEVMVRSIAGGKVAYTDKNGAEKTVKADSIVLYSGLKPKTEEAYEFTGTADEVYLLGDCTGKNGHLQKAVRSAFFTASQV
jgi:pyruvate/2-oxoglutarate dehydrogenase complex dihydrolipoamide dehydrogenase (E3) component